MTVYYGNNDSVWNKNIEDIYLVNGESSNLENIHDLMIPRVLPNSFKENIQSIISLATLNEIKTLINNKQSAGYYILQWDGKDSFGNKVVSGIYLYQIKAADFVCTKKMALMK